MLPVKYESWLDKFLQGRKTEAYVQLQHETDAALKSQRGAIEELAKRRREEAQKKRGNS